jgi:hypothetical protein
MGERRRCSRKKLNALANRSWALPVLVARAPARERVSLLQGAIAELQRPYCVARDGKNKPATPLLSLRVRILTEMLIKRETLTPRNDRGLRGFDVLGRSARVQSSSFAVGRRPPR